jgi:peptidoglycan hydrolase FlgJ
VSLAPIADAGGLAGLRAAAARGDAHALEEAAVQFEALFVGMLLKSARSASLGESLLDGGNTQQYLEMMDGQVALDIAKGGGLGFGRMLVEQLGGAAAPPPHRSHAKEAATDAGRPFAQGSIPARSASAASPAASSASALTPARRSDPIAAEAHRDPVNAREQFVRTLLPHAERAAERLGVDPKLLVAQAALETGWGASIPRFADGRSTHNLFGMKAGPSWSGAKAGTWTLEIADGMPERRRADFRAYASLGDSFADYANVIGSLPRYAEALRSAKDPEGYARAVADAGYATDPSYAAKWLDVYRSDALARVDGTGLAQPAQESAPPADNAHIATASDGADGLAGAPGNENRALLDALTARMD